jgi:hypothetical protein
MSQNYLKQVVTLHLFYFPTFNSGNNIDVNGITKKELLFMVLGIIMIILGLLMGNWSFKNSNRPPGYRPGVFETELSSCMMSFIPLCLIVGGIYLIITD